MLSVLFSFVTEASDIKIITSDVKTEQLSHLSISPQSIGFKITSLHRSCIMLQNGPSSFFSFTLVGTIRVIREKQGKLDNLSAISSSLTGRPGNLRLASIHISPLS